MRKLTAAKNKKIDQARFAIWKGRGYCLPPMPLHAAPLRLGFSGTVEGYEGDGKIKKDPGLGPTRPGRTRALTCGALATLPPFHLTEIPWVEAGAKGREAALGTKYAVSTSSSTGGPSSGWQLRQVPWLKTRIIGEESCVGLPVR